MRRLPPLGPVQAFVQAARLGSLKAAADSLALSSPALTRRIQSLEHFVGATLFERQHNLIQLNDRGLAFLREIEPHLDALAGAVERLTDSGGAVRIRLAVPSLFASQRLVPALSSLKREHPNLLVEVDTAAERLSRLSDGVDAAIAITESVEPRHYSRLIEQGRIVAIGAKSLLDDGHVCQPSDLSRMTVLLHREMPRAFVEWRREAGFAGLEAAVYCFYDAGQLILDAAAEGLGIAFMLESHLQSSSDRRLVRLFGQSVESPYSYWFACTPSALRRPGVQIFHDWIFNRSGLAAGDKPNGHKPFAAQSASKVEARG